MAHVNFCTHRRILGPEVCEWFTGDGHRVNEFLPRRQLRWGKQTSRRDPWGCHWYCSGCGPGSHFPGGSNGKEPAGQRRKCKRQNFHPWVGRFPGEGNGNPLQYSCLENPMDRGAWWAVVHSVAESGRTEATWHVACTGPDCYHGPQGKPVQDFWPKSRVFSSLSGLS